MAEVNTGGGHEEKKGKPKKQNLRVDFTPMVDMNMLLITFFMFCTTLSKPQMMNLVVPTKDKPTDTKDVTKIDVDRTVTLILSENDIAYYYFGEPNYTEYTSLIESNYSPDGLRKMIVEKNGKAINEMKNLRAFKQTKQDIDAQTFEDLCKLVTDKDDLVKIRDLRKAQNTKKLTDEQFKIFSKGIRDAKDGLAVVIKPTDASTYKNLVDVLDEMQICAIGKYAIVPLNDGDSFLVDNYRQKGALSAQAAKIAARNKR